MPRYMGDTVGPTETQLGLSSQFLWHFQQIHIIAFLLDLLGETLYHGLITPLSNK